MNLDPVTPSKVYFRVRVRVNDIGVLIISCIAPKHVTMCNSTTMDDRRRTTTLPLPP